jgi:hypothetical protein
MMLGVVFALLVSSAFAQDQRIVTKNDNTFDFVGMSGQIKITPSVTKNTGNWIKSNWDKLYEIDANGNTIPPGVNLASQPFSWTYPVSTTWGPNNDPADMTSLIATLNNGAFLNVTCWVFNATTYIINGESTFIIGTNAVKYSVAIENWPWSADATNLTFGVRIQSKGGRNLLDVHANETAAQYVVDYGIGGIANYMKAFYDGVEGPVGVHAAISSNSVYLTWTFNKFATSVEYDPVFWASSSRVLASFTTILLLSFALLSLL